MSRIWKQVLAAVLIVASALAARALAQDRATVVPGMKVLLESIRSIGAWDRTRRSSSSSMRRPKPLRRPIWTILRAILAPMPSPNRIP